MHKELTLSIPVLLSSLLEPLKCRVIQWLQSFQFFYIVGLLHLVIGRENLPEDFIMVLFQFRLRFTYFNHLLLLNIVFDILVEFTYLLLFFSYLDYLWTVLNTILFVNDCYNTIFWVVRSFWHLGVYWFWCLGLTFLLITVFQMLFIKNQGSIYLILVWYKVIIINIDLFRVLAWNFKC